MKKLLKGFKNEKGQAMVEFAIVLPLLLLVICAIIDFGWIFYNNISVNNCSREGARYAIVHSTEANKVQLITQRITDTAPDGLKNNLEITITFSNIQNPTDGDVTVTVVGKVTALTPVVGIFAGGQVIRLTSKTTMKVE